MKTFVFFFGEHLHLDWKNRSNFREDLFFFFFFFFFGEHLHLDWKNRSNFREDLFFFFSENTFIWTGKTVQISGKTFFLFFFFFFFFGEHLNLGRKNRLNFDRETQCIKSFFGQKFAAPPNHFELLRPCKRVLNFILHCKIDSLILLLTTH